MKLNEIITESQLQEGPLLNKLGTAVGKGVGAVAKGAGAVAGGIAGIGSAFKKGYAAGKGTVASAGDDEPAPATSTGSTKSAAAPTAGTDTTTAAPAVTKPQVKPAATAQDTKPIATPTAQVKPQVKPTATDTAAPAAPAANDTQYAQAQKAIAALKPEEQKQILTALQADPKVKAAMDKAAQNKKTAGTQAAPSTDTRNWDEVTGAPISDKAKAEYEKFTPQQKAEIEKNIADQKASQTPAGVAKKKRAPTQAEIDADRARIMGPTSDSVIRKGRSIVENIDEAGLMAKLGTKVGQAAQAAGNVAGSAARGVDIAKNDPEHAAAMVKAFKTGQTNPSQAVAAKIRDASGTVPPTIIEKLNSLTVEQRNELHTLLVRKTA